MSVPGTRSPLRATAARGQKLYAKWTMAIRPGGIENMTVNKSWELHKQSWAARVRFLVREGSGGSNDRKGNHSKVARAYC